MASEELGPKCPCPSPAVSAPTGEGAGVEVAGVEAATAEVGREDGGEARKPPGTGEDIGGEASDDTDEAAAPASKPQEEKEEEKEDKVWQALDRVLDEWFVFGIHRAAAKKFIHAKVANPSCTSCERARRWLLLRMNGRVWNHGYPLMCRSADNVPGLRSFHVWPAQEEAFPWLREVEARHVEILEELLSVRQRARGGNKLCGFQPYRDPIPAGTAGEDGEEKAVGKPPVLAAKDGVGIEGVDSGAWNVLYLFLNHKVFEENVANFPKTVACIKACFPRHYTHAFFSALTPGSHIMKHTGPSNRMLRVWLPLCGLDGFRLRVGDTILRPEAGKCFVWDHSYEHEAWHEGMETRVVLIVDIWHPDLSDDEVKFLGTLQNCRLRAGRHLSEIAAQQAGANGPESDTYFEIIEKARHLLTDDDWWVIKAEQDPTTRPT